MLSNNNYPYGWYKEHSKYDCSERENSSKNEISSVNDETLTCSFIETKNHALYFCLSHDKYGNDKVNEWKKGLKLRKLLLCD